jgi:NurA-like 5'-3' nuclease
MPTKNKMPEANLTEIIEGLLTADVKFILVGGLAAVIQGAPFTTMDVDIVHSQSPDNILKLFEFLQSINAIYRRPDDKIIAPKEKDFLSKGQVLLSTQKGPLDVLAFIEEGKTYNDLLKHTIEIEFRGRKIHVLDIKMLTELKKKSRDPKDKLKLPVLEETVRQLEKK